jgi:uncharacterized membrane protein
MRGPLHPPFVHFPIALLGTSLLFDAGGLYTAAASWWTLSFWNIALGLAIAVITMSTGFVDYLRVDEASPAQPTLTRHMTAVFVALSCYGGALAVRGGTGAPSGGVRLASLALEALGLVSLLVGGWLGGELVYRHGVGRK